MKSQPADSLELLLDKLCQGDDAAAEQVFLAYEPYLRMVVRRHLSAQMRSKFDSFDVVQSVWADLVHGFREAGWRFADSAHLRAFLVKVTRNRFIDRFRQNSPAVEREQPITGSETEALPPSQQPRPSEMVQADELWEQIVKLCPAPHRDLLHLKREGKSLAEIAEQTGLHESSVRRILYDLARRFAERQETADGAAEAGY